MKSSMAWDRAEIDGRWFEQGQVSRGVTQSRKDAKGLQGGLTTSQLVLCAASIAMRDGTCVIDDSLHSISVTPCLCEITCRLIGDLETWTFLPGTVFSRSHKNTEELQA